MSGGNRSEASLAFQELWADMRPAGARVPGRSDIELTDFAEFLDLLAIVEVDATSRTMPLRFVGSFIRDLVKFELTGTSYLDYVEGADTEASWRKRLAVLDHPCGRYETVMINFPGEVRMECSLTCLPVIGNDDERYNLVLVEPAEKLPHLKAGEIANTATPASVQEFFDIGAGVPEGKAGM